MASNMYNFGKGEFLDGDIDWTADTIRLGLNYAAYTSDPDHTYPDDSGGPADTGNEASGTGYSRKDLASKGVTVNDTDDRAEADAADVTWTGLDCGTITGAFVYKFVTSDSDSPLICWLDFTDLTTNGGDVTLQFATAGLFYI
jgi:hypothetical protein